MFWKGLQHVDCSKYWRSDVQVGCRNISNLEHLKELAVWAPLVKKHPSFSLHSQIFIDGKGGKATNVFVETQIQ